MSYKLKKQSGLVKTTPYTSEPKDMLGVMKDPIVFELFPIGVETQFRIRRFIKAAGSPNQDEHAYAVGATRIGGWNITDENDEAVPFSQDNFSAFLNDPDTIDYVADVGYMTIKEALPEPVQAEEAVTPEGKPDSGQTASPNPVGTASPLQSNSDTTIES